MIRKLLNFIIFRIKNPTCVVHYSVSVSRKTRIGKNCIIGKNCAIAKSVKIGNNVRIGSRVILTNIQIGDNSMLESDIKIVGTGKGNIIIGKECYVGVNNVFDTSDNITIGDYVHIAGPSTGLWCHSSANMCLNSIALNAPHRDLYRPTGSINIQDNVYIGGNCTIYPGIVLHHHSIVAPNSAVNKDVQSYTLVGGVPAKFIKTIAPENE